LRPWPQDAANFLVELIAPSAAAFACWALVNMPSRTTEPGDATRSGTSNNQGNLGEGRPESPVNLRLRPEMCSWPLWDGDTGENVSHYHIDIPVDLAERIENWDDRFQGTYNEDDPASSSFATAEAEQAYVDEGREIVRALTQAWSGRLDVEERFR